MSSPIYPKQPVFFFAHLFYVQKQGGSFRRVFGSREVVSWEPKVPPPKATPPINKALLRDY